VETLNEIDLSMQTALLIEITDRVAHVAYNRGFNNIAYFNRIFKNKKECTPESSEKASANLPARVSPDKMFYKNMQV
jgi:AraC-like DNA-binding protein